MAWAYDLKYITVAGFEGKVAGKFWHFFFAGCCLLEVFCFSVELGDVIS